MGLFKFVSNIFGADGEPAQPLSTNKMDDTAAEVRDCYQRSQQWLSQNYWDQWTKAFQNYKCEPPPFMDPNDPNVEDPEQTVVGMPDTWALVRRFVARMTAQEPSHRFSGDDPDVADRITRTLMYDWDKGKQQKIQKRHVTQAALFGWSVKSWYWAVEEHNRKRRVNPITAPPDMQSEFESQYADKIAQYRQEFANVPPEQQWQQIAMKLIQDVGKGQLVPIEYLYKCYEGPKADFMFIGDCYPEPNFLSIQSSRWFIVERRRNLEWVENFVEAYKDKYPQVMDNVEKLLQEYPNGTPRDKVTSNKDVTNLRTRMRDAINMIDTQGGVEDPPKSVLLPEWTFVERHIPGSKPMLDIVAEGTLLLASIPYPHDLEGQIAFTELTFIDDLLAGIGDSTPRIIRTLNDLHNRNTSKKADLIYNLLRPLVYTTNPALYESPDLLKRGKGFRLVKVDGAGEIGVLGEQGALAAAAASDADEGSIARAIQLASGESNLSMSSNVDPQQARTATGARLMAFNGDILTKDMTGQLTFSLVDDLEMMRLLSRSEMTEEVEVQADSYRRQFGGQYAPPAPNLKIKATPEDFQNDGDIEVEVGSTLADDDDTKLSRAQMLFSTAMQSPGLINVQTARDELLIALGKGKEIDKWQTPPPQPPPPEVPKINYTVSIPLDKQPQDVQIALLEKAGVGPPQPEPQMGPPGPGMPPPGMPPGGPPMPHPPMGMHPPHPPMQGPPPGPSNGLPMSELDAALGRHR